MLRKLKCSAYQRQGTCLWIETANLPTRFFSKETLDIIRESFVGQRRTSSSSASIPGSSAVPSILRKPRLLGKRTEELKLLRGQQSDIKDDRGYEQDNTPRKMRKEKPLRGSPGRKPRHVGNPRRIPDMFRVHSWQELSKLADKHHDWLKWKQLMAFYHRTVQIYKTMSPAQQAEMRKSGLLEKYRDRAEELDLGKADTTFINVMTRACSTMAWDMGQPTLERLDKRLQAIAAVEKWKQEDEKQRLKQTRIAGEGRGFGSSSLYQQKARLKTY